MAEHSTEQPEIKDASSDHETDNLAPRGAITFGVIMIIGYAFYFFMIWSEVIARGGQ
jgi:hypothetical protein